MTLRVVCVEEPTLPSHPIWSRSLPMPDNKSSNTDEG